MDWKLEDQLQSVIILLTNKDLNSELGCLHDLRNNAWEPICNAFSTRQPTTRAPCRWSLPFPGPDACSSPLQNTATSSFSCGFHTGSIARRLDWGLWKKGLWQKTCSNTTRRIKLVRAPALTLPALDFRQVIQPLCASAFLTVKWGQKTPFFRMLMWGLQTDPCIRVQ